MAKKKIARRRRADGAPTKASVIREIHNADKSLGPTAVAKAAAEKCGIKLTPTLVSQAWSILKQSGNKKGRKKGITQTKPKGHFADNGLVAFESAVAFAKQVGGIDQAGALIATLAEIKAKL
jgi:hypothetical protein